MPGPRRRCRFGHREKFRPRDAGIDGAGRGVADAGLMSQGDEFERGAATNPEREKGTESGHKREHADDGMTAAPRPSCIFGLIGISSNYSRR